MAENTRQYKMIVLIKEGLEVTTKGQNIFVAGDLFWYPVEGRPDIKLAPDVLVAIGRPKGDRGSYMQWLEDDIPPQVIFEIRSPNDSDKLMEKKLHFYRRYGVKEYYVYDLDKNIFSVYLRQGRQLLKVPQAREWTSPLLNISFNWTEESLEIFHPNGEPFLSPAETAELKEKEKLRADQEKLRADYANWKAEQEKLRAEQEKQRAEQEKQRADQAEEQIRALQEKLKALQG